MIELQYEMAYEETIAGPLGSTQGSPLGERHAQLLTDGGELILFRYDLGVIRSTERFLAALTAGEATEFGDQYMRMAPQFEVGADRYAWLRESLFVGRGRLTGPRAITYELYRVE